MIYYYIFNIIRIKPFNIRKTILIFAKKVKI